MGGDERVDDGLGWKDEMSTLPSLPPSLFGFSRFRDAIVIAFFHADGSRIDVTILPFSHFRRHINISSISKGVR
jgi:hypothetical protein